MRSLSAMAESFPYAVQPGVTSAGEQDDPLPKSADVVVIGAGIMGCSTAWYLARKGLSVVLLDRGRTAFQQSGRNWGFVRKLCRDPREVPLANLALSLWPQLSAELGHDVSWRQTGCMFLAATQEESQSYEQWQRDCEGLIPDTRMLSRQELERRFPQVKSTGFGAIIAEHDGQAEPVAATTAMAKAARREGARLVENCGVQRIETQGGAVCGVVVERGRIATSTVVCTAGATSYRLLRGLLPVLPQKTVRSSVALSEPIPDLKLPCFVGEGLGLRQRADGSCLLATDAGADIDFTLDSFRNSGFFLPELMRNRKAFALKFGKPFFDDLYARAVLNREQRNILPRAPKIAVNTRRIDMTRSLFTKIFGLKPPRILHSWAGNIDVLPDALPVIETASKVTGLVVATGFSGHGFGVGPAIGKTLGDVISGSESSIDLRPFSSDRFAAGTYGRPYGTI